MLVQLTMRGFLWDPPRVPHITTSHGSLILLEGVWPLQTFPYFAHWFAVRVTLQDGQSRTVRQFHFTDWTEHGVPCSGETFIEFIGQVHKTKEQFGHDGPITVHCRSVDSVACPVTAEHQHHGCQVIITPMRVIIAPFPPPRPLSFTRLLPSPVSGGVRVSPKENSCSNYRP